MPIQEQEGARKEMKKTKKLLIIALSVFIFGAVICFSAFASVGFDIRVFEGGGYTVKEEIIKDKITDISVDSAATDIKILEWNEPSIKVIYSENDYLKTDVKITDGKLLINIEDTRKWYDLTRYISSAPKDVTLYLPKNESYKLNAKSLSGDFISSYGGEFNSLNVNLSSGDVFAHGMKVLNSLSLKTTSGDIEIGNLRAGGRSAFDVTSGDVNIGTANFGGDLQINITSGDVELGRVAGKKMKIETVSGDVEFETISTEEIEIETTSGDVEGAFVGEMIYQANTTSGDIRVPNSERNGAFCRIKTTSGDINISKR